MLWDRALLLRARSLPEHGFPACVLLEQPHSCCSLTLGDVNTPLHWHRGYTLRSQELTHRLPTVLVRSWGFWSWFTAAFLQGGSTEFPESLPWPALQLSFRHRGPYLAMPHFRPLWTTQTHLLASCR